MILSQPTSPSAALKAAKTLIGSFAHLRPDNAEVFVASIGAVLAQYPLGLVEECVDPRRGMARTVEFLSVKSVVDWCDTRLAHHSAIASYAGPPPKRIEQEFSEAEMKRGGAALRGLFRALKEGRDLRALTFDDAIDLGAAE